MTESLILKKKGKENMYCSNFRNCSLFTFIHFPSLNQQNKNISDDILISRHHMKARL